jgi:serine/threonine-protein kinase
VKSALTPLAPGATIGPYVLSQPLGRGSTATVYLARNGDREVALKVRGRGEIELDRRFLREFEALRGLSVAGVVSVYDAGMDDRWLWYAMDVVHGIPIRSWIEAAGSVTARVERLLHVAPTLCDALAGIHRAGILHRDLKPSNVLVDPHGLPHVLDFGVARAWADGDPLTGEGGLVGTLPFMSPEQVAGQPLTMRSDLFAVGLMLYEGVVGRRPRPSRPHEWLRIQCMERPRPLATLDLAVPLAVSAVIDRLVAFDPRDRPDAAEAAVLFRACAAGKGPRTWPEANAYVGSPPPLEVAEELVRGEGPRLFVLAGPAGSGRRRAAEHVQRRALLAGLRVVRGRCRVERPGGAIEEVLDALLEAPADPAWRLLVGGGDTGALLEMWPHLPLEPLAGPGFAASAQDVVQAASSALVRATGRGLLIVLEDLDEIDRFTARLLDRLARIAPKELAIVCTVDDRHAPRRAFRVVGELVQLRLATLHRLPDLDTATASAIASALVPPGHAVSVGAASPLGATEAGHAALGALRGQPPPRLPPAAFAAALEPGALPVVAWRALGVDPDALEAAGVLERVGPARLRVASTTARASALARLVKRTAEARRLAEAWTLDTTAARHAGRARALLLADDTAAAFGPAVSAALEAERRGRYREARDWLVVVDALPRDRTSDDYARLRFSLAACRAAVAMAIGAERPREDLVSIAAARAKTEPERGVAALLGADLARRQGDVRGALVVYLKVASLLAESAPEVAVRALLRAAELRLEHGAPDDAVQALDRAEQLRDFCRGDFDQVRIDGLRAEAELARGRLHPSVELCLRGLRLAAGIGYGPGAAGLHLQLGLAYYQLGDRAQAEASVERARRTRVETGERGAAAAAAAWLGWLLLGRGDVAAAHMLGQEAWTVGKRLNLRAVRGLAHALLLQVATVRADVVAAERVLDDAASTGPLDGLLAISAIRWWRSQGEPGRALEAAAAAPTAGFLGVEARLEHARTLMSRGDRALARPLLDAAGADARAAGYRELVLYERVLRTGVSPATEDVWEQLVEAATASAWVDLYLWIIELDGHRRAARGDVAGARRRFQELAARAAEHGHRPYLRAAEESLGGI